MITSVPAIVIRMDSQTFTLCQMRKLIMIKLDMVAVEPADRSKPPTARVMVSPIAMTVVTAMERKIVVKLSLVAKVFGILTEKNANKNITVMTAAQSRMIFPTLRLFFIFAPTVIFLLSNST